MSKLHLACGSIYLDGYINCDAWGKLANQVKTNPNITTLDKYYKIPFEKDPSKRVRTEPIIDCKMNLLEVWPFEDNSVEDIVMICAWEHFNSKTQIPHIVSEANRVLCVGGSFRFDFPDIKKAVELFADSDMEYCAELIYCNQKNIYSQHFWCYNEKTILLYLSEDKWKLEFKQIIPHSYPMIGCEAIKV